MATKSKSGGVKVKNIQLPAFVSKNLATWALSFSSFASLTHD